MRVRKGHQIVEGVKPLPVLSERPAPPPEEPSLYDTTLTELVSEIERMREVIAYTMRDRDAETKRAEKAERTIRRIRHLPCYSTDGVIDSDARGFAWMSANDVLAALDGE
jgi:hypothetical protein